jgi:hypothetical protein
MEPASTGRAARLRRAAPYLVAIAWLALGTAFLARGLAHPGVAYRPWAFRNYAYSDLLAMSGDRYLNGGRPFPYLEDRIEYPVLLGLALWAPSFLPGGQAGHLAGSVLLLGACLLAAVWVLRRLPGARPWWLAATPALAYYGALNWDLLPIALMLGALLSLEQGRSARAGALVGLGVSAKLWPVALVPPALAALGAGRRWGAAARLLSALVGVLVAVNLPFAWLAPGNWSWFFRFNGGRSAENSVWEVLRLSQPGLLNALTAALLAAAVGLAAAVAWRSAARGGGARSGDGVPAPRGREAVRLGTALILVAWVATNKVWSPQYALYAFAAGAVVAAPAWLFAALSVVSVLDYHLAFEVRAERGIFWFFDGWYFAEEVVRTAVYAAFIGWILRRMWIVRLGSAPGLGLGAGGRETPSPRGGLNAETR